MEELSEALKALDLGYPNDHEFDYEFISSFYNPNKLPINQIHLEKTLLEVSKDADWKCKSGDDASKYFKQQSEVIPALDKRWLPKLQVFHKFEPYNFTTEENELFISKNWLFLKSLSYLLCCNYHQFWCSILYEPNVGVSLHSFALNPIFPHQLEELSREEASLYVSVLSQCLQVYERLIKFRESDEEYVAEDIGVRYLLDSKILSLPIVLTLILIYQEINLKFVNNLASLYFRGSSIFRDKEVEEMFDHILLTFEMIGGHICGFEPGAVIIPIAIEERPAVFSLNWVYSVVDYLMNSISVLHVLLKFYKVSTGVALEKGVPYRLSFAYEHIFYNLYDYLWGREELDQNPRLSKLIFDNIALARSEFIDIFNCFVTHCLDKVLEFSGNSLRQEEYVEIYLKLIQTAVEDEYFICDYHEKYDVGVQNEMFSSCTELDTTRTDYLLNCVKASRRHNRIWKTLKGEKKTLMKAIRKYTKNHEIEVKQNGFDQPSKTESFNFQPSEEDIEEMIKTVIDMFPHLGDGFVLNCLQAYNYQASDVISAILEENLPPHIVDIPFDEIRIPPEPKPAEPTLAYKGKKTEYNDALSLLNDKRDLKKIKTFILDGIQYTNEFDVYDDEYDDRLDEETVKVKDYGSEDVLKYNPNYEDAVSDTSYSETEFDEKGEAVVASTSGGGKGKGDFCEDPAVVRARREARLRSQGKIRDVVGKPKGQGQEKNVNQNRQKKNVNKSSRANHNRKTGAQWKRSRGMMPS